MTFSLAARCARTGMFGMVVSSSSPAVAARCAHAQAGVGAAASQNVTDPALGRQMLDLMAHGASAEEAVAIAARSTPFGAYRQLTAVDGQGGVGVHIGAKTLGTHGAARSQNVVAAGNLLANPEVPARMVAAFVKTEGHLAHRLITALVAGQAAGGEAGPVHSAGLLVVERTSWPLVDLRVDWHDEDPIKALALAWEIYAPQMQAYIDRALDPSAAPSYGVPGDP